MVAWNKDPEIDDGIAEHAVDFLRHRINDFGLSMVYGVDGPKLKGKCNDRILMIEFKNLLSNKK